MKLFITAFALMCIGVSAEAQLFAKAESTEYKQEYVSPLVVNSAKHVAYKISLPPGIACEMLEEHLQ